MAEVIAVEPEFTINPKGTCRFSGGGVITIRSSGGVAVLGGTDMGLYGDDTDSPHVKGDAVTSGSLEAKMPTNPQPLKDVEIQLMANLHQSAFHCVVDV